MPRGTREVTLLGAMKRRIARVLISMSEKRIYLVGSRYLDRLVVAIYRSFHSSDRSPSYHIVIPTIGNGNLGDQAMFEAYLKAVPGKIVAILSSSDDLDVNAEDKNRVEVQSLRSLVNGLPIGRLRARIRYVQLLKNAASLSIIGADVMDGGYSRRDSVLRSHILLMASDLGVPCRVLGFSWNAAPDAVAQRYLVEASRNAVLNLRDPRSFERINQTGCSNTVETVDTVFSLDRICPVQEISPWLAEQESAGRRLAIVNTSGLLALKYDLQGHYDKIVDYLVESGYSVAILSHVIRPGDNDLEQASELYERHLSQPVFLVNRLWSPANVSWLTRQAVVTITGRMHLAILSLVQGTPAVTFASQGKVEGMLALYGLEHYAVDPNSNVASETIKLIAMSDQEPLLSRDRILSISSRLATVAQSNFQSLECV